MRHRYETSQWVPFPTAQVFSFFSNPDNLPKLMPPWQKARIEHAFLGAPPLSPLHWNKTSRVAGKGSVLTITFRAVPYVPVRLTWTAVITEFAWNDHFCDEQKSGPMGYWKHCHTIKAETRGGVDGSLVTDNVTYALPLGPLGDLAYALVIRRQMSGTFDFRQKMLQQLLPASNATAQKIA